MRGIDLLSSSLVSPQGRESPVLAIDGADTVTAGIEISRAPERAIVLARARNNDSPKRLPERFPADSEQRNSLTSCRNGGARGEEWIDDRSGSLSHTA